jgi:hypothetical protein
MARTSKTVIGEEAGDRAAANRQALSEGQAGVRQSHAELMAQKQHGQELAFRSAQEIGQFTQRERERTQQGQQFEAQQKQQGEQFNAQLAQQREIETGRQALEQQQIDVGAAKEGYARTGKETTSPLLDQRMQKLQQDMNQGGEMGPPSPEQQRRMDQAGKPLEMQGATQPFAPTEQGQAIEKRKGYEAETKRMTAETYRMQASAQLEKARAIGDKEAEKEVKGRLMNDLNSDSKMLNSFATGKVTDYDWEKLRQMSADSPDQDLKKEIDSGIAGPNIRRFLESKVSRSVFNYIKDTNGELPDSNHVDMGSPTMQVFSQSVKHFKDLITTMVPQLGQFAGFKSMADRNRMLNRLAVARTENMSGGFFERVARGINQGIESMGGGGGGPAEAPNPFQGMSPSAGTPQQKPQPNQAGAARQPTAGPMRPGPH